MEHAIHRVTGFQIIGPYMLAVRFADGTNRTIDFSPVLAGELYGPLRELSLFNRVKVDSEVHTLVWPNGADFDPAIALFRQHVRLAQLSVASPFDIDVYL